MLALAVFLGVAALAPAVHGACTMHPWYAGPDGTIQNTNGVFPTPNCRDCGLPYPQGCYNTPNGMPCYVPCDPTFGVGPVPSTGSDDAVWLCPAVGTEFAMPNSEGHCVQQVWTTDDDHWKGEYTVAILVGVIGLCVCCGLLGGCFYAGSQYTKLQKRALREETMSEAASVVSDVASDISHMDHTVVPSVAPPQQFMMTQPQQPLMMTTPGFGPASVFAPGTVQMMGSGTIG